MSHSEIVAVLPWYVNGTLGEAERRAVEAHLGGCHDCLREVEALRGLAANVRAWAEEAPLPQGDRWPALLARLEAAPSLASRLREAWSAWWDTVPALARLGLAAQLILLLGLGTAFLLRRPAVLETAAGPAVAGPATGTPLVLGFVEEAPEREVRRVIQAVGGRIVSGPSALGLYTVEIPVPPERGGEVEKALDELRREKTVVQFARRAF